MSGRDLNADVLRGLKAEAEIAETAAAFEAVRAALLAAISRPRLALIASARSDRACSSTSNKTMPRQMPET